MSLRERLHIPSRKVLRRTTPKLAALVLLPYMAWQGANFVWPDGGYSPGMRIPFTEQRIKIKPRKEHWASHMAGHYRADDAWNLPKYVRKGMPPSWADGIDRWFEDPTLPDFAHRMAPDASTYAESWMKYTTHSHINPLENDWGADGRKIAQLEVVLAEEKLDYKPAHMPAAEDITEVRARLERLPPRNRPYSGSWFAMSQAKAEESVGPALAPAMRYVINEERMAQIRQEHDYLFDDPVGDRERLRDELSGYDLSRDLGCPLNALYAFGAGWLFHRRYRKYNAKRTWQEDPAP